LLGLFLLIRTECGLGGGKAIMMPASEKQIQPTVFYNLFKEYETRSED
jgi:hypothetical protein